jgi:hypothetical protein
MSPDRIHGRRLEFQYLKGGIPTVDSITACAAYFQSPAYPVHEVQKFNIRLQ